MNRTTPHGSKIHALLIEADAAVRDAVCAALHPVENARLALQTVSTLDAAVSRMSEVSFDVVLLGASLLDGSRASSIAHLRNSFPRVALILVAPADDELVLEALRERIQDYVLTDHLNGELLLRRMRAAIERKRLEEEEHVMTGLAERVAAARDFTSTLHVLLSMIGEYTSSALARAWLPVPADGGFSAGPVWSPAGSDLADFNRHCVLENAKSRQSLLLEALSSPEVRWVASLKEEKRYPCAREADQAGLKTVLIAPVTAEGQTTAVLEYLMAEGRARDDRVVRLVTAAAAQAGVAFLRYRSEEALRQDEGRFRRLIEAGYNGYAIHENGIIREASQGYAAIFGCTAREMIGRTMTEFIAPEEREAVLTKLRGQFEGNYEFTAVRRGGARFPAEVIAMPYRFQGRPARIGAVRDISHRKSAEDRLAQLNELFVGLGPDPSTNIDKLVIFAGERMRSDWAVYALQESDRLSPKGHWKLPPGAFAPGTPLAGFCRDVFQDAGKQVISSSPEPLSRHGDTRPIVLSARGETYIGRVVWTGGAPAGVLCLGYAIPLDLNLEDRRFLGIVASAIGAEQEKWAAMTVKEGLEHDLRQSQKMEAVGRLAGGVAHDFNNLLTAIVGCTEMVLERMAESDPNRGDLVEVHRAGLRAADLTRQLLAFSRKQVLRMEVLDLNAILGGIRTLLARLLREDIEADIRVSETPCFVKADRGQIEQVLVNLAVNARDAMPKGGRLTIRLEAVDVPVVAAVLVGKVLSGPIARLVVADTGSGMDAETLGHIFEPFFTTKERGRGTGLGLATVYGIVAQSAGTITVTSEMGKGTEFRIELPRTEEKRESSRKLQAVSTRGGNETILVVEDEDSVRQLAVRTLRLRGYTVLEARNGQEALAVAAATKEKISLLLSDVVMPGMHGPSLAHRLKESGREMKVTYMSGYADDALSEEGVLQPGVNLLNKPFTPTQLASYIRGVLDGH